MVNYISNFDTTAELATFSATTDFGRPHVSLTKDDSKVHYFEDPYNGHQYVEIGGLKWATMNVGANSVTDTGLYFSWGDTQGYTAAQVGSGEGQKYFGWTDYKYNSGGTLPSAADMTKYNSTDGKTMLEASDDAARANWGGSWRMPTKDEYAALFNAVNTAWTSSYNSSGVAGIICTDKTDSSKVLFFPACGFCGTGSVYTVGSSGTYWSSSLYSSDVRNTHSLYLANFGVDYQYNIPDRYYGYPVRGVVG